MINLIISPHADDEVLGCASILNGDSFVVYCGIDEKGIKNRPTEDERCQEIDEVRKESGHKYQILDNAVNKYKEIDLIEDLEKAINLKKPRHIFIPHPSYNQDHRAVYEAALIALRPHDKNYFVKKVLVYEQPHVFLWDNNYGDFIPNYFISVDIKRKIRLYDVMKSQVRKHRSKEILKSMAKLRGSQSNKKYAEAFQILRWID